MSQYFQQSFFFQQKKRPLLKRIRKPIDLQSLYGGDKREPVLTFRPQRSEIGDTVLKSPRHRRPLSSVSRQSSVHLPPVDTSGPRLTTNQVCIKLTTNYCVVRERIKSCNEMLITASLIKIV